MYIIKQLSIDSESGAFLASTGLKAKVTKYSYGRPRFFMVPDSFWGGTNISLLPNGKYIETFPENHIIIDYVNSYKVTSLKTAKRILNMSVGEKDYDNIEGYMIFIKNGSQFETNGEVVHGGFVRQAIIVLKEGQYLNFSRQKIKVVDGKLMHQI